MLLQPQIGTIRLPVITSDGVYIFNLSRMVCKSLTIKKKIKIIYTSICLIGVAAGTLELCSWNFEIFLFEVANDLVVLFFFLLEFYFIFIFIFFIFMSFVFCLFVFVCSPLCFSFLFLHQFSSFFVSGFVFSFLSRGCIVKDCFVRSLYLLIGE